MRILRAISSLFIFLYHKITGKVTNPEIEDINDALDQALQKQALDRLKIKKDVQKYWRKNYGYSSARSKFIRKNPVPLLKLKVAAISKFGKKMQEYNLELDDNLTWNK